MQRFSLDIPFLIGQNASLEHSPDFTIAMDSATQTPRPETPADESLFTPAEIREFDADDVEAGKNLCKMLSLFFFYTVIVMGLSTLVTYVWVVS